MGHNFYHFPQQLLMNNILTKQKSLIVAPASIFCGSLGAAGKTMIGCRLTALAMFAGLAMTFGVCVSEAAPLQPTQVRVIDNFEQLGIDNPSPRFGWVVNDPARGAVQSAYQIIVARSQPAFDNAGDVVWDSGKVASSEQYGVMYAGAALEKTTKYWWKVRTSGCAGAGFALERCPPLHHVFLQAGGLERAGRLDWR